MLKSCLGISCVLAIALLTGCEILDKTEHEQNVNVSSSVKHVSITVSYQGGAFYRVQVKNTLPTAINLIWDESTYVTTTGESVRILHLQNKYDIPQYAPAQQAPSSIPPNSQFQADFTGDDWLDCAQRNCTPQPKNSLKNARIVLAFNIKGKRVRWWGEISFAPSRQP